MFDQITVQVKIHLFIIQFFGYFFLFKPKITKLHIENQVEHQLWKIHIGDPFCVEWKY